MLKKSSFILTATLVMVFVFPLGLMAPAQAAPPGPLPEQAGLYAVPGHPNLMLRVFVYHGKPDGVGNGKPAPFVPTLVCQSTTVVDQDSTAVVPGAGWTLPSAWTYNLNLASVPSSVGSTNLVTVADNGFNAWLGVNDVNAAVNITRGSDTSITRAQRDYQNIITWGRTSGSALATTYIWYDTTTHEAVEIDTIMNKKFTWYWSNPSTWPANQTCAYSGVYDAQNILTHELGHTFGLDDTYTSAYVNNTMYGSGSKGETKKNTLTTGDANGVAALY